MPSVRDRMVPPMRRQRAVGLARARCWSPFSAESLRFIGLGHPNAVVFDETYYAKDGFSLITWLVERVPIKDADKALLAGNTDIWQQCTAATLDKCASYVVHPPLGKWMIGVGEWLFGMNPVRLAVRGGGGRDVVDPDSGAGGAADDAVDVAGVFRGVAAGVGRAALRAVAVRRCWTFS